MSADDFMDETDIQAELTSTNPHSFYRGMIRAAQADAQQVIDLSRDLAEARRQLMALGNQLEFDRSLVADCITRAKKAIARRSWLTEGRGSYEWDDNRLHEEFGEAAKEFLDAIEPMKKVARDWSNCPKTAEGIANARIDLESQLAASQQRERELKRIAELASLVSMNGLFLICDECGHQDSIDDCDFMAELRDALRAMPEGKP